MTFREIKELLTKPVGAPNAGDAVKRRSVQVPTDVVGVELGAGDSRGCPAVRLVRRKGIWVVRSLGFVPPPQGAMPTSWKELDNQPTWALPSSFAAPAAALAVNSPDQVVRQTTMESLSDGGNKQIEPGVPISHDGLRFRVEPLGEASFVLESGLPEYQVLWLSRLLPEGKRPTACSVQTASVAMLAALSEQPAFAAEGGNAASLFVTGSAIYFVGFRGGVPVLFREFPGIGGLKRIRETVRAGFGMTEEKLVDEMLDDTLVDPTPILGPIVNPVLRQLELSLDYMNNRLGISVKQVFLMGLPSGARHWGRMAERVLNVKLVSPDLFNGVDLPVKFDREADALLKRSHTFLAAFGAARAALEGAK